MKRPPSTGLVRIKGPHALLQTAPEPYAKAVLLFMQMVVTP